MRPTHDNVLVERLDGREEELMENGLFRPQKQGQWGRGVERHRVMAVGKGRFVKKHSPWDTIRAGGLRPRVPMSVKPGDIVLIPYQVGQAVPNPYQFICREEEILAVLEEG